LVNWWQAPGRWSRPRRPAPKGRQLGETTRKACRPVPTMPAGRPGGRAVAKMLFLLFPEALGFMGALHATDGGWTAYGRF
jgi:hypothetical protein